MNWSGCERWVLPALVLILPLGCDDGSTGPGEFSVAELAGSWDAVELSVTSQADPTMALRLIDGGGAMHWAIQPSGAFLGTAVVPGVLLELPEVGAVTVPVAGMIQLLDPATLRMEFIPELPPFFTVIDGEFSLAGKTLSLTNEMILYDFGPGRPEEPAVFRAVLERNR